ncbi:NAD(P)/FAD-dependent oxidoreductase [Pseudonocardia spirodelae]|uniref:FAD-dependent monooxygenase n=1 Tax=Pseudonocardia spirodelae TaxID=3133431 RepID=A0ABU8T623_9PSEU
MDAHTDVVVVGSRCAGSAAAIALARRGRPVVALDGATFPSDTLSTHLFFPHHWAELERLGARDRVLALDPPLHARASLGTPEVEIAGRYRAYEGIAHGSCVRRPGLDLALVETARQAGAEVRERTRVTALLRDDAGRVVGVRWADREQNEGEIRAKLVIGADGRRSTVARLVGTREHHRWDNQRMMAFAYYDDPREELRATAAQWRAGEDLVTVFPCDGGQSIVLLMPPVSRAGDFRRDAAGTFDAIVAGVPPMVERLAGCTRVGSVRTSRSHPSYFRHSHGPGWALAGDAGHFKDPVTAQGIRDALRFGRLLGEAAAPYLDDPADLDAALARWEADRDEQCLPMYQWANGLGRDDDVSPLEAASYRWFAASEDRATELFDVFSRHRAPSSVFTPARLAGWVRDGLRDPSVGTGEVWRTLRRDVGREIARVREQRAFARRRAESAARGLTPGPDATTAGRTATGAGAAR